MLLTDTDIKINIWSPAIAWFSGEQIVSEIKGSVFD